MSNQEILEKAIQKAIDGGWTAFGFSNCDVTPVVKEIQFRDKEHGVILASCGISTMIFNHDFAKALWGNSLNVAGVYEHNMDNGVTSFVLPGWKYLLQQMVIADDPIKYLGENMSSIEK